MRKAPIKTFITLSSGLCVEKWALQHALGQLPDATPYGFHRLAQHGHDIRFATHKQNRTQARIARAARHRTGGLELVEALTVARQYSEFSADVVVAHDEHTGLPALLLTSRSQAPPVVTGIGWLTARSSAHRVMRRIAATGLPRAAGVWVQSEPMLHPVREEWGLAASRLHYLPVGIDTDFYSRQPPAERTGVIVSAGEDRFRDHALLINAVQEVRRARPDVRLELATSEPVELPLEWGTLHTRRLYGGMRALYQRSSVVAVALRPTIMGSGLSVILEAMASGRPVVATNNPGLSEYVEHGETGLLVPSGDTQAFARAINELLRDTAQAEEMGRKGALAVRSKFTSENTALELAKMLQQL